MIVLFIYLFVKVFYSEFSMKNNTYSIVRRLVMYCSIFMVNPKLNTLTLKLEQYLYIDVTILHFRE